MKNKIHDEQEIKKKGNKKIIVNNLKESDMTNLNSKKKGNNDNKENSGDENYDKELSDNNSIQNLEELQNIKQIQEKLKDMWFIILPTYFWKKVWDNFLAFLIIYIVIVIPLKLSFYSDKKYLGWDILDYIIDGLFFTDMVITFFTAYIDEEENLVIDRWKIAKKYLKSWFIFDLVSILPFELFFSSDSNYSSISSLFRISKLPKLSKFIRITKIFKSMRILQNQNNMWSYLYDILKLSPGFDRLIINLFSIFIFCHIFACVWYFAATFENDPDGWICNILKNKRNDVLESYLASLYWITQTVITVGYGDIGAKTNVEKILAIFAMFAGVIFFSLTIGSLTSILSDMDAKNTIYERKINTLISIQSKYNISADLFTRVQKALKYGVYKSDEKYNDFLEMLPSKLKIELGCLMHKKTLDKIYFFQKRDHRFLAFVGPLLKKVSFNPSDIIFNEGEYANEMYFIQSGTVTMILKEFENLPIMVCKTGYHFGEIDLILNQPRKFSYMAQTDVELLTLLKSDFMKVFFNEFPKIGKEMQINSKLRRERQLNAYEGAKNKCNELLEKQDNNEGNGNDKEFAKMKNAMALNKIKVDKNEDENEKEIMKRLKIMEKNMESAQEKLENLFQNLEKVGLNYDDEEDEEEEEENNKNNNNDKNKELKEDSYSENYSFGNTEEEKNN